MDDDDRPLGRLLTRREVLALLGTTGLWALTGCGRKPALESAARTRLSQAGCIVRPEQTEGPYFVDKQLERTDLRGDPGDGSTVPGTALELAFRISALGATGCTPLAGAVVDVWGCDAQGRYSGVRDRSFDTTGRKFLRGFQRTDAEGRALFTTIYPGWYPGRAVHLHFKIRSEPAAERGAEFTSQLYFDDALTDRVHALAPYAAHGTRDLRNAGDFIFSRGGSELVLALSPKNAGYAAWFDVALAEA